MRPYEHKVQYYETDKMGISHHSNYIRWMEEARTDFLEQLGWGYDRLEESGIVSPVTALECRYKANTTYPDRVLIRVTVAEMTGVRLRIKYEMSLSGGKTVCEAYSEHCFLDHDGRVLRLKKERPEFYAALEALI